MSTSNRNRIYIRFPYKEHFESSRFLHRQPAWEQYLWALKREVLSKLQDSPWNETKFSSISFGGASNWLQHPKLIEQVFDFLLTNLPLEPNDCHLILRCNLNDISEALLDQLQEWSGIHLFIRTGNYHSSLQKNHNYSACSPKLRQVCRLISERREESFGLGITTGYRILSPLEFRDDIRCLLELRPPLIKTGTPRKKNNMLPLSRGLQTQLTKHTKNRAHQKRRQLSKQALREALACAGYTTHKSSIFTLESSNFPTLIDPHSILGVGAGAVTLFHSSPNKSSRSRTINSHRTRDYINDWRSTNKQKIESSIQLDLIDQYHACLMQTLATGEAIDLSVIESNYGVSIPDIHPGLIEILIETGFIEKKNSSIALSGKGLLQAEKVTTNFFIREQDLEYLTRPITKSKAAMIDSEKQKAVR